MVERDGEPALTLGAVADEAGLARATVYGFFSGRGELLDAIDLAEPRGPRLVAVSAPAPAEDETEIWANCQPDLAAYVPEQEPAQEDAPPERGPLAEPAAMAPLAEAQAAAGAAENDTPLENQGEPAATPPLAEAQADVDAVEGDTPVKHQAEPASAAPLAEILADAAQDEAPSELPAEAEPAAEPLSVEAAPDAAMPSEHEPAIALPADELARDERRRLHASHLEEIAKRLILPESALKDGTDAVIARLDTRIRVLEKSIAGLETRQSATEAEAPRRLKPVADRLDQLGARMDGADARTLQTVSELRLGVHQLETRLGALEGPHKPVLPEWAHEPALDVEPVIAAPAPGSEDGESAPDNPRHAYLSNVRTLAKEGARQMEERASVEEAEREARRRRMVVAASVALLCLGAIGVLYLVNPGAHGVSMARSTPAPAPVATAHPQAAPLDRLSALAMKGDAHAQVLVGLKYLESNDKLAADWLTRAAAQNDAVAENALGALYQKGRGVTADIGAATRLYQAAAARGNRHAMSNLAMLYAGAGGGAANFAEAARWFQRSASLGYVDAEFNLAVLYERGDGVGQSLLEAYKWYAVAAEAGDAVAKTRADAIATQLSPDELAAAQRAALEFKPLAVDRAANDVPTLETVLAAR